MYNLHVVPGFIDVLWTLSHRNTNLPLTAAEFLAYQPAVQLSLSTDLYQHTHTLFVFSEYATYSFLPCSVQLLYEH